MIYQPLICIHSFASFFFMLVLKHIDNQPSTLPLQEEESHFSPSELLNLNWMVFRRQKAKKKSSVLSLFSRQANEKHVMMLLSTPLKSVPFFFDFSLFCD